MSALHLIGGGGASLASVLEPPAIVASLDDLAVMRHTVQERRGHLGVSEDLRPFAERQVCRHQHRGPLVELGEQMEQELGAVAGERQVAKLIEHDDIRPGQSAGQAAPFPGELFLFQEIGQVHKIEKSRSDAFSYGPGHVRQRGVNSGVLEVAIGQAALGGIWAGCASLGWVLSSAMASTCM